MCDNDSLVESSIKGIKGIKSLSMNCVQISLQKLLFTLYCFNQCVIPSLQP